MVTKKDVSKVFRALRQLGYYAKQDFACCLTCGWAEVPEGEEKVVFYHHQDSDAFKKGILVRPLYLAWQGNANEIYNAITSNNLEYEHDGSENKRIAILP
jgi:hypothetical protein